jgi:catalase-peroxidase
MDKKQCPFHGSKTNLDSNTQNWWPNQLNLDILRQHDTKSNPFTNFNYKKEVKLLNLNDLKQDIKKVMHESQAWWPADYNHYGPFFIRMTWHQAGTYRVGDGRGGANTGNQRFAPLNSWPDNGNLDKARRLLWPVKQKYGNKISWADLLIVAGNVAIEDMGGPNHGTALGREDIWHPEKDIYWGSEDKWLGDNRYGSTRQDLENPLAAVQMGLIYVNPEGPNSNPDPLLSAQDIRETFKRMAMNDEETFALIAGGHTFGKAHGNGPVSCVGVAPEEAKIEQQGFGWENTHGTGHGIDTITSGIEGPWTSNPIKWDMGYLTLLFKYEWKLTKSPAGAHQWYPINCALDDMAPEVDGSNKKVLPMMTTADMALKMDPIYNELGNKFLKNPVYFGETFAKAWFKLLHRDMGPKSNYIAGDYKDVDYIWQDPVPPGKKDYNITEIKNIIKNYNLNPQNMIETALAAASTFRSSDNRGGVNGARIRFAPQINWEANNIKMLAPILKVYQDISKQTQVSIADIIVLAANLAIENNCNHNIEIPFYPGRGDALESETDVNSFEYLKPKACAFRNYCEKEFAVLPEELMLDKAQLLGLSPVELTVLIGGMRSLGISRDKKGIWTNEIALNNQWFKILLSMDVKWVNAGFNSYNALDQNNGKIIRTASRIDLIFGSNSELRAISEFYAQDDNNEKFIHDFIKAWNKIINADRFDIFDK